MTSRKQYVPAQKEWSTHEFIGIVRTQENQTRPKSDGVSGLEAGVVMGSVKKLSEIDSCTGGGVCWRHSI